MMNKNVIFIFIVVAMVAGGFYFFSKPIAKASSSHVKEVWYCPMHPSYTSDRPGHCPICSMDLVKRKDATQESNQPMMTHAPISINTAQQQLLGIRTQKVVKKPLVKLLRIPGHVAHDLELYEAQLAYIEAWQQYYAYRSRRPVKEEFKSDWREYFIKPSNRARSSDLREAQVKLVKAEYELQHMGITPEQMAKLRTIKYGQPWVDPQLLFFHDAQKVWVYADLHEQDLGYVTVGQQVSVDVPSFKETWQGQVRAVVNVVDPQTHTVRLRIEMSNVRSELAVNMLVEVTIHVELNDMLQVPIDAVMDTGIEQIVYVAHGDGQFEPRIVKVQAIGNDMAAIQHGLKEGEEIVIDGNFMLDSESRLKSVMSQGAQQ